MRVAFIVNEWKDSSGGGIKFYLLSLVGELKKKNNLEITVLFRDGQDYENHLIEGNKLIFLIRSFLKLKEINPQVIHSHGAWYCLLPGYIYKKVYGAKLVHTFHTQQTKKLSIFGRFFLQHLLNGCDYVTFVSKSLKNNCEKHGLKFKRTAITYAGMSLRTVSQEEVKEFRDLFGIKYNNFVLLAQGFTANEFKAEGAKILIKAVKHLLVKYPNIVLVLTREEKFSEFLKTFAKLEGVSESVIFTGDVQNPFVPVKICDIYTHVSLADGGLSLALLEAMIMGKPVLATNIGGIPEAINDGVNGILVEPSQEKIIESIEYLMINQNIGSKLGDKAKQTVLTKFTWRITADIFENIYNY